ncbi:hypothetical protein OIDMADRAFT_56809 [Oidiodendron maius Zn]|uniref:Carbonic anhydrase n=1 Tax=Oidiodendron maius (strain Zn) TaxID=913774 RepID=A0A0C3D938_OIDMZ|nr:hypothetical protein OIDMADRAFT_56809 [Oidiodendron maius Zn]
MPALGLPKPQTLIITCADPRILPEKFLDLGPSMSNTVNERRETSGILTVSLEIVGPLIIRNVCGHVAPAMEDIVSLDYLLHFRDILIIQHTDCGALMIKNEHIHNYIRKELPEAKDVEKLKFGGIIDITQSVKDDLAILRATPLIRKELQEHSYGVILDIKTGIMTEV